MTALPSTLGAVPGGTGWQRSSEPSAQMVVPSVQRAPEKSVRSRSVPIKHRPGQVRTAQIGLEQPRRAQARARQLGAAEVGAGEVGLHQVGAAEIHPLHDGGHELARRAWTWLRLARDRSERLNELSRRSALLRSTPVRFSSSSRQRRHSAPGAAASVQAAMAGWPARRAARVAHEKSERPLHRRFNPSRTLGRSWRAGRRPVPRSSRARPERARTLHHIH